MTMTTLLSPGMHGKPERRGWLAKKFPEKFLLPKVDLFQIIIIKLHIYYMLFGAIYNMLSKEHSAC